VQFARRAVALFDQSRHPSSAATVCAVCDGSAVSDEHPPGTEEAAETHETALSPMASDGERSPVPAPDAAAEAPAASLPTTSSSRWEMARRALALLLVVIAAGGFVWGTRVR
jgi:hypothetical protein